ncbi:hypothetical protein ACTFIY_008553 [Dictyostelium cf. discoideum]
MFNFVVKSRILNRLKPSPSIIFKRNFSIIGGNKMILRQDNNIPLNNRNINNQFSSNIINNTTSTTATHKPEILLDIQQQQQQQQQQPPQQLVQQPQQQQQPQLQLPSPTLIGKLVTLRKMKIEDRDDILKASTDGELWNLKVTIVPGPTTVDKYIDIAMGGVSNGTVIPFVIINNENEKIIGSTRFWKVDIVNRKLEIGHTWLCKSIQRSGVNTECKYLLLKFAFEEMNAIRVQFTTDELNETSQKAILRIGAIKEGVIRHERIMPDGRKRNSIRYSIIDSEWEQVKLKLSNMMNK